MVIDKQPYWEKLVDYYYDVVHWEYGAPRNIYDWLKQEYTITSDTGSTVLNFENERKLTFFVMRFGS